ncbi:MAG: hypothetical protein RJA07_1130 [Bacteroidota bacterium]|jgi:hypothetical protein
MKKIVITCLSLIANIMGLYAQQEYTHPTTGCGISYYYDFKGNRVARQFHCVNECPCPQMPDCNCNQGERIATKKPIAVANDSVASVSIYPNPTMEKFYIEFTDNDIKAQVTVLTNAGQQVSTQAATCRRMEYSLSGLPAGMYYLVVNKNNKTTKYKVVKMND